MVLAAIVGCGGTSVAILDGSDAGGGRDGSFSVDASASADGSIDRTVVADARTRDVAVDNDPRCPGFADASGNCSVGLACVYPAGRCFCRGYCGGPAPDPNTDYSHWACEPWRTDGCPDDQPTGGSGCAQEGLRCTYAPCCVTEAICERGSWQVSGPSCPP
jgi:hypothetical protein